MSKPIPVKKLCKVCDTMVAERHTHEGVYLYPHKGPCKHPCRGGRLFDGGMGTAHGRNCPCVKVATSDF